MLLALLPAASVAVAVGVSVDAVVWVRRAVPEKAECIRRYQKAPEGMRRDPKLPEGIRRHAKGSEGSEGMRRDQKACEGITRQGGGVGKVVEQVS